MKKRVLSFLLAALMVLSVLPFGAAAAGFSDVKSGAYYYDAVQWAVQQKVTAGTSASTFSPGATCTRAQVVTFLWRAKGQPEPSGKSNPFRDVKTGDYFYKAVLWAVEKGVTKGTSSTAFSPSAGCTRGQVVTFLHRAKGEPAPSGANAFLDVKPGDYFYKAVCWAVGRGVTAGADVAAFAPNASCTRGQIVTFLYRDLSGQGRAPGMDSRMATAYGNIVRERESSYGRGSFTGEWMKGVACVRLIDLNNDGTLELLLWENTLTNNFPGVATVEIWTWSGGNAKRVFNGYALMGGDPSGQELALIKMDGQYELIVGENGGAIDQEFYGMSGSSMVRKHTLREDYRNGTSTLYFDGKYFSTSDFRSLHNRVISLCNAYLSSGAASSLLTETNTTRAVLGL